MNGNRYDELWLWKIWKILIFKLFIASHIFNMVLSSVKIQNISACNSSSKPIKRQVIQSEIVNREIEEERV